MTLFRGITKPNTPASVATDVPAIESFDVAVEGLFEVPELIVAFEAHDDTVTNLSRLYAVMESEGLSPSLLAYADEENLLSSTVVNFPSVESLKTSAGLEGYGQGTPQLQAALEGLIEKAKETVTNWAKAAWGAVTGLVEKGMNVAKAAGEKIAQFAGWVKTKTLNAAKAAKETIQAHPYVSAAAAVAALTAVGVIVTTVVWPGTLPATASAFASYAKTLGEKVKNLVVPGTTMTVREDAQGIIIDVEKNTAAKIKDGTLNALGYTQEKIRKLADDAAAALKSGGEGIMKALNWLKTNGGALIRKAGEKGGEALTWARKTVRTALSATWKLLSGAVMAAVNVLRSLFGKLRSFFGGGGKDAGGPPKQLPGPKNPPQLPGPKS